MPKLQLPPEKVQFVTEEGRLAFVRLLPGQAEAPDDRPETLVYGVEYSSPDPGQQIVNATSFVAQAHDSGIEPPTITHMGVVYQNQRVGRPTWERHVFGPTGRLHRLEEMEKRKQSIEKYAYAAGCFVINFKKTFNKDTVNMKDANLGDPVQRAEFVKRVADNAPKVTRFLDPRNPFDVDWAKNENERRRFANMSLIDVTNLQNYQRAVEPHEIWSGCYGRIAGRAYWDDRHQKTVLYGLDAVLMTRQGERLTSRVDPDKLFGGYAPAAELQPQMPTQLPQQFGGYQMGAGYQTRDLKNLF